MLTWLKVTICYITLVTSSLANTECLTKQLVVDLWEMNAEGFTNKKDTRIKKIKD